MFYISGRHKQTNTILSVLPYTGHFVWFVYSSVTLLDLALIWILRVLKLKSRINGENCAVLTQWSVHNGIP